jgi:hypothetical protein
VLHATGLVFLQISDTSSSACARVCLCVCVCVGLNANLYPVTFGVLKIVSDHKDSLL